MENTKTTLILNKKMVRKNKALRANRKLSLKTYGKAPKSLLRNKFGKVSICKNSNEATIFANDNAKDIAKGMDIKTLIDRCKETGLTGMSGNGFPVYKKLETFLDVSTSKRHIIINGVECEPGLIHDQWLIDHEIDRIVEEAKILGELFHASSVTIAAKNCSKENLNLPEKVSFYKVPVRYPMGEEKMLIRQIFGVTMDTAELPIEKGFLVINVQTLLQIFHVLSGQGADGRFVTLCDLDTGAAYATYVTYDQLIKDKMLELFDEKKYCKCGFGIMDARDVSEKDKFTPTICFVAAASEVAETDCSNKCRGCGKCRKVCPMGINVKKIILKLGNNDFEELNKLGISQCIGCASCSYVCAANKNPHQIIGGYNAKIKR